MTITRSYNKHTNTTYAYETTYVWSDERQRKVQKKKCIGKFDPQTDEIIPNGRRGRPQGTKNPDIRPTEHSVDTGDSLSNTKSRQSIELIAERCAEIERGIACCSSALSEMRKGLTKIWRDDGSH